MQLHLTFPMWTLPVARKLRLGDDKHNQANNTPHHRKKYFSSSERERIAQQGLLTAPPAQEHTRVRSRSRKPTPEPSHTSTLPDDWKPNSDRKVKQSMTSSLLRPRRRYHPQPNAELNQQQPTVSQDQAAWFLALPDKVKRQHFSKEEQVLLAQRCEIVLGSKAAKVKQESTQEFVRRRLLEFDFLSDSTPRAKPKKKESAQDFCRRQLFEQSEGGPGAKRRRRLSAPESTAFGDQGLEDSKSVAASEAVDDSEGDRMSSILNLYTRRHSVATTSEPVTAPPIVAPAQIRSFRKSFMLRPLPLPAPVLAPLPSPTFLKDTSNDQQRLTKQRRRPAPLVVTPPEMSAEAKHYKDPEMRRTLRAMSSPELFDEAIEFGFPPPASEPPQSANQRSRFSMETAHFDRTSSLTSSSTAETRDSQFSKCPATPDGPGDFLISPHCTSLRLSPTNQKQSPTPPVHRRAHTADIPTIGGPTFGHSRTPSSLNREMTLRLTLTRPLLRSSETDPNAMRKPSLIEPLHRGAFERDPLALESIYICDDPTGAQGAFAVPESSQQRKGIKSAFRNPFRK
jgi:hypothetical protein